MRTRPPIRGVRFVVGRVAGLREDPGSAPSRVRRKVEWRDCGALLDCHSNWTAVIHLMKARGLDEPPCTVTAEFAVKLKRPTPMAGPLHLRAKVGSVEGDKVTVDAELEAGGRITATCHGVFVAVREGHPAFHRW